MAPVLTMLFTPLFAVMLVVAAVVYATTGLRGAFDRDPSRPAGRMDRIQLVAVVAALLLDAMVLTSMLARIGELGFTPTHLPVFALWAATVVVVLPPLLSFS